jgi:flavin reductase (DIM6/NTAB) family NADH-FMN oxidoreductase RutF
MKRNDIKTNEFDLQVVKAFLNDWMLLTSGDYSKNDFNMMTIAWGSVGVMWNKPFVMVVVRPQRYTYKFMEENDDFTLTAFSDKYKDSLKLCGTKSGRDINKVEESGLKPISSKSIKSPGFEEAELIIECKKIYIDDFKPDNFLVPEIDKSYPDKDYHRIYFGEIVNISGTDKYRS